jgi:hypothetical protein
LSPLQKSKQVLYIAGGIHLTLLCIALWAGWPRSLNSSPSRGKSLLFSVLSRLILGATEPPIKWVLGKSFPRSESTQGEADKSPPTSAEVNNTWNYVLHYSIRFHGTMRT